MTQPIKSQTVEGTFESRRIVRMIDIILPEFDHNKKIDGQKALVFSGSTNYDIIFGRDFLSMIELKIDFQNNNMEWMEQIIQMKDIKYWDNHKKYINLKYNYRELSPQTLSMFHS